MRYKMYLSGKKFENAGVPIHDNVTFLNSEVRCSQTKHHTTLKCYTHISHMKYLISKSILQLSEVQSPSKKKIYFLNNYLFSQKHHPQYFLLIIYRQRRKSSISLWNKISPYMIITGTTYFQTFHIFVQLHNMHPAFSSLYKRKRIHIPMYQDYKKVFYLYNIL